MERKEAIRSAYRLTGGNNFYDGIPKTNIGCGLLLSAREHDQKDPPYQTTANNVNTS